MSQESLFDRPDFRRDLTTTGKNHPDTSVEAGQRVLPRSGTYRRIVFLFILRAFPEGYTDEEMQSLLAMPPNTQRPRRNELMNDDWIVDSGKRRKNASGLNAIVWIYNPR